MQETNVRWIYYYSMWKVSPGGVLHSATFTMYNIRCIQCLAYARENGCAWYETTCANAAKRGHLECLKYAKSHCC